jgi:hypothetical protein
MSLALAENVEDTNTRSREVTEAVLTVYPDNIAGQAKAKVSMFIRTEGEK